MRAKKAWTGFTFIIVLRLWRVFRLIFREYLARFLYLFSFRGDFAHAHVDISFRSSCCRFLVLIAFKEEFYELIEDGPKPAENEETTAEIQAGEIEEKQK